MVYWRTPQLVRFFIYLVLVALISCSGKKEKVNSCEKEFQFISNFLESNLPAYKDIQKGNNILEYQAFKKNIQSSISSNLNKQKCVKNLVQYVEYFPDNHTKLRLTVSQPIDENNATQLNEFLNSKRYKSTRIVDITQGELMQKKNFNEIEGLYTSSDSAFTVLVKKDKSLFSDYIGVIIESKTKLWKKGQVKFELKKKSRNLFDGFFYSRYHDLSYDTSVNFQNGILNDDWFKVDKNNNVNYSVNVSDDLDFKIFRDFAYIRIPSFLSKYSRKIDSLYKEKDSIIKTKPYLIIDVRNNGGGNTSNVLPLIDYFYSNPIIDDEKVELYVTRNIIDLYKNDLADIMKDSVNYNTETINAFKEGVDQLTSAKLNTFIPYGNANDTIIKKPLVYPKKVAILYNRGCASACEDLLFLAKKSNKAVLVGENSGGFVGYGNIFTIKTPVFQLGLTFTTTRYSTQKDFEVDGIAPDFYLSYDKDWINQTKKILQK